MVLLEFGAVAVFAGLVSAWAMWVYPKLKCDSAMNAMAYTSGDHASYNMTPCSKKEDGDRTPMIAEKKEEDLEHEASNDGEALYWNGQRYVAKSVNEEIKHDENYFQ